MSKCSPATKAELDWIKKVQKALDTCPNKEQVWLYSNGLGRIYVMKTPADGNEMRPDGGVNDENIIGHLKFRSDGGDW